MAKKNAVTEMIEWKDSEGRQKFIASYNASMEEALKDMPSVFKVINSDLYRNVAPSQSVRDEFARYDYNTFRPGESIPTDPKGMINAAMSAYKKSGNGIIKNIVDLMTDFTIQGIDVAHPDKKAEQALKFWFHKVINGRNRSEHFVSLACRASNIIIKRDTAKLPLKIVRKMYKSTSEADVEYKETELTTEKREFPVNYTFYHPLSIEVIVPELTSLINIKEKRFGLIIPTEVRAKVQYPKTESEKEMVSKLPPEYINAIRDGEKVIPLPPDKVDAYYYKKDDWEIWAQPMIYTVLEDVRHLEKLKLADLCALDGALSQIRIWRIGNMEKGIKPSKAAFSKLANTLMNGVAGGILDLMWTEDLDFQEVTSSIHNFLGETKYLPVLNAIYTGLGIPPLFTGSSNQGSFTNNFLAIKTLIERLETLRNLLKEFWSKELAIVSKALGLTVQPSLTFDRMTLNDESSVLTLLLHLVDRGYLSIETMQEMVGATPEIEEFRIRREWKQQESGKRPPKASPFHRPQWKETYTDDFIKLGELTPSEVGLELEDRKAGEMSPSDKRGSQSPKDMPSDLNGRPPGKKDSVKRKTKTVKPRRSVNQLLQSIMYASAAQKDISEILTPIYLGMVDKKNVRQLTDEQFRELENLKFASLASFSPFQPIETDSLVAKIASKEIQPVPEFMVTIYEGLSEDYLSNNKEITVDKQREIQAIAYSMFFIDELFDE